MQKEWQMQRPRGRSRPDLHKEEQARASATGLGWTKGRKWEERWERSWTAGGIRISKSLKFTYRTMIFTKTLYLLLLGWSPSPTLPPSPPALLILHVSNQSGLFLRLPHHTAWQNEALSPLTLTATRAYPKLYCTIASIRVLPVFWLDYVPDT